MVKDLQPKRLPASFKYAARGLWHVIRTEQNLRIHAGAALIAVALALYFGISAVEWAVLLLVIGLVIVTEVFNTVAEDFLDIIHPDRHPTVRRIKDALAGAVLVAALVAVGAGLLIFMPHLLARLG